MTQSTAGKDDGPTEWMVEMATTIVDEVRQQNWKNGGVLSLDRPDAIRLVAARLDLVHSKGRLNAANEVVDRLKERGR